jgi:hypothetical protein
LLVILACAAGEFAMLTVFALATAVMRTPGAETNAPGDRFRLALAIVLAISLPVLTLTASVARFSASLRDRRLANLRLLGLSPLRTRVVAAVEAGTGAVVGMALGSGLFALLRPALAHVRMGGFHWPVRDFVPVWSSWILAVIAVPLVATAVAALPRRMNIAAAVATARKADSRRPAWWRAVPLAVGLVVCLATSGMTDGDDIGMTGALILMGAMALTGIGVLLVVPIFVRLLADALLRLSRRPGMLIAARRMQAQPAGVSRVVAALMLGLFVVAGARLVLAAFESTPQYVEADHDIHVAQVSVVDTSARRLPTARETISRLPGVRASAEFVQVRARYVVDGEDLTMNVLVGSCADLLRVAPATTGCSDHEARWLNGEGYGSPARVLVSRARQWIVPSSHLMSVDRDSSIREWADLFVPEGLLPADRIAKASRTIVVLAGPGRDLAGHLQSAKLYGSYPDYETYDFVSGLRAVLWAISIAVLSVGLLAFAVSGIDRALARRRELASLQVLGTPPEVLRRAQWWEAALSTGIGAILAIGAGWLAGLSYLRVGESHPVVPWASMTLFATCALVAAGLVAGLTVLATNVRLTPDVIRSE